jgi:hypothetical protein
MGFVLTFAKKIRRSLIQELMALYTVAIRRVGSKLNYCDITLLPTNDVV